MVVGNLGDGAAILCRGGKAVPLSTAQTPGRPDETARIERANGWVHVHDWMDDRIEDVIDRIEGLIDD